MNLLTQSVCSWMLEGLPRNIFLGSKLHLVSNCIKSEEGEDVDIAKVILVQDCGFGIVQCLTDISLKDINEKSVIYYANDKVLVYLESI